MRKISLFLLLIPFSLLAQKSSNTCEILSKINALVQNGHYQPKPVDDSLSVYVFDTFIDGLDPTRNIFTKSEYDKISRHRKSIDDYILSGDCSFFGEFMAIYRQALERKKSNLIRLQTVPLEYNGKDSIRFSRKQFPFDMTEKTMDKVVKKRMRIDILSEISDMSDNLDSLNQHFASIEKKAKAKILEANICKINSILDNDFESRTQAIFLDTFCNYFDPHSNYFNVDTKSSFLSQLSTSNLSLGIDMTLNEKQEIVVVDIVPGGPAAKNEMIEKDDIVIKVSNKKGVEFMVSCVSLDAVGEMIFSDANKEIQLTVRKKNGVIKTVSLKKEVMKAMNNNVFSFIAEKETRVGYIRIPNFYSDFDGNSVLGCADDVVKEIAKLQEDNIKGLIIDIQDNGGGSMEEATKLVGMFIDYGPVAVLSNSENKQTILKDMSHGSAYNGPMVILINGQSASASEFFAGAMQDYKRALVVGSTSLGKASMQQIIPLDRDNKNDYVKLTLEKFYRITGDSGQIKGIIPDIEMPVLFDSIVQREKSYKTALKYDTITTYTRFKRFPFAHNNEIISLSQARVKSSPEFTELANINTKINGIYGNLKKPIPLTLRDFFTDSHENDAFWEKVKKFAEKPNNCNIINTSYEKEKLQFDAFRREINEYQMKDVKSNPYIEESINILNDINTFKTN
ncbi:MAG TPA: carboxy terminal-processing peptidase [Flavobacterium sp.]|nr:carboxy terminal-processing peptidase [Flavobacterium sp.]